MTIEELAKWHSEHVNLHDGKGPYAARHRATAALLRELVDKRSKADVNESNDELRSLVFSDESLESESDRLLKECGE